MPRNPLNADEEPDRDPEYFDEVIAEDLVDCYPPPIEEDKHLPRAIVGGSDERVPIANTANRPYRWVCQILGTRSGSGRNKAGTGFVISQNCILTAGHNLWLGENNVAPGNRIDQFLVYPGVNGDRNDPEFGAHVALQSIPHPIFESTLLARFDCALLFLTQDLPATFGVMPWLVVDPGQLQGMKALVSGYPLCKPHTICHRGQPPQAVQYRDVGNLFYHDGMLQYAADTTEGESGAPVIVAAKNASNQLVSTAVAIHTHGTNLGNSGVPITSEIGSFIHHYLQQSNPSSWA